MNKKMLVTIVLLVTVAVLLVGCAGADESISTVEFEPASAATPGPDQLPENVENPADSTGTNLTEAELAAVTQNAVDEALAENPPLAADRLTDDEIYSGDNMVDAGASGFVAPTATDITFSVVTTITGPAGFTPVWPDHELIAIEPVNHVEDRAVWQSYEVTPGAYIVHDGSGVITPVGAYYNAENSCEGGHMHNDTPVTIQIWLRSEGRAVSVVPVDPSTMDEFARENLKAITSGNRCAAAYLGQIPLTEDQLAAQK